MILVDVFVKSVKNHWVYDGPFSKSMCFFSRGTPRATQRNTDATWRVLYHIVVRTLYARRMFREYVRSWESLFLFCVVSLYLTCDRYAGLHALAKSEAKEFYTTCKVRDKLWQQRAENDLDTPTALSGQKGWRNPQPGL